MPFYKYRAEDGEEKELFQNISEMKNEIDIDGKIYKRVFESSGNFILSGMGWTTKPSADGLGTPQRYKEVGIKVDYDKKKAMEKSGEKI